MSTRVAGHVPLSEQGKVVRAWKLWIVAIGIVALTVIGLYLTITRWQKDTEYALMLFGYFLGPAIAAAVGYFWCLPEVLGGTCRDQGRTLLQKWSDYALLCSFIGILIVEGSYIQVVREVFHDISLPRALAILIVSPWVLIACVVASKEYLSWTMPSAPSGNRTGWRNGVRRGMEWSGSRLVGLLKTNVALVAGALLVLASLVLVESGRVFGPDYRGYEVVTGANVGWSSAYPAGSAGLGMFVLAWTHRSAYLLGILLAVAALVGVVVKRHKNETQSYRILAAAAGIATLSEITKLGLTRQRWAAGTPLIILWSILWLAPIVTWFVTNRANVEGWDRTRLAIMLFYLPMFLLWLTFLPFETYLSMGYGAFMTGMLLLWWGFLQGGSQTYADPTAH